MMMIRDRTRGSERGREKNTSVLAVRDKTHDEWASSRGINKSIMCDKCLGFIRLRQGQNHKSSRPSMNTAATLHCGSPKSEKKPKIIGELFKTE